MYCFIIKEIDEYHPAGIVADFARSKAEQLYKDGFIADPAIKAEIHQRKWKSGSFVLPGEEKELPKIDKSDSDKSESNEENKPESFLGKVIKKVK